MFFHHEGPRTLPIILIIFGIALVLNGLDILKINFSILIGLLLLIWGLSFFWKRWQ